MKFRYVAVAVAAMLPLPLLAQTQQIRPPIALYWMSVETAGGMGMDIPSGMGGLMPPGMQGGKKMKLELGSSQQASGDAHAAHAIPAGLAMGQSLPLVTPRIERAPKRERDEEPGFEQPKGRMLIYWGCGETVRPGQPVIIDFANMNSQDAARAFRSRAISRPRGPAPGRNRTYGTWPNQEDSRPIPPAGSLRGDHTISGNYSPEIRFSVDEPHDFMDAVVFDPVRKTAGGAYAVKWKLVPTATGYFATATGQGENQNDMVTWSSSEVQEMGQVLMDYIPPAEVGAPDPRESGDAAADHRVHRPRRDIQERRFDVEFHRLRQRAEPGASAAAERPEADLGTGMGGEAAAQIHGDDPARRARGRRAACKKLRARAQLRNRPHSRRRRGARHRRRRISRKRRPMRCRKA